MPLYRRLLGPDWGTLAEAVRRNHYDGFPFRAVGTFQIRHGTHPVGCLLARLSGMPPPGLAVDTVLVIREHGDGERWLRQFDGRAFATTQGARDGLLVERFGPMEIRLRLIARDGALHYRQVGAACRLGPLLLPIPRGMAPRVEAIEAPDASGRSSIRVIVAAPIVGTLIEYEGVIERQEEWS